MKMKRLKVRETLLISNNWVDLSFSITNAEKHFKDLLRDDIFPPVDYRRYISMEVVVDDGGTGWTIEGVRWETPQETAARIYKGVKDEIEHAKED